MKLEFSQIPLNDFSHFECKDSDLHKNLVVTLESYLAYIDTHKAESERNLVANALKALLFDKLGFVSIAEQSQCMIAFIKRIAEFESVWVCIDPRDKDAKKFVLSSCKKEIKNGTLQILDVRSNDVWARDFAPLTIRQNNQNIKPFKLIALPFPKPIYHKKERLPASYANFLFVNGGLLVPIYGDKKALHILQDALPHHRVIGVPAKTLIKWHGSLHCTTMQIY